MSTVHRSRRAVCGLAAFLWLVPGIAMAQTQNNVVSIKKSDKQIVVRLSSTTEFDVRNDLIELNVGDKKFTQSYYPEGRLGVIEFIIPEGEFSKLKDGDPIWVSFQSQGRRGKFWDFERLDKSKFSK